MTLGQNIRSYRIDKGMTQKELGNKLDVSQAMIGQYESGSRNPKLATIYKIAEALDIDIKHLIETSFITNTSPEFQKNASSVIPELTQKETLRKNLLHHYDKLNERGQRESIKRIIELTKLDEYSK